MKIPTVIDTSYERRFIGGHFQFSRIGGDFDRNDATIKGYFLTPAPKIDRNIRDRAIESFHANIYDAIKDIDDFNGLITAVVSPVSGYQAALLWKEDCPITYTPAAWHKEDDEFKQIPFEPCSRELNIFGLEMPHYMALLRSKGTKEDLEVYKNSWVENQELI